MKISIARQFHLVVRFRNGETRDCGYFTYGQLANLQEAIAPLLRPKDLVSLVSPDARAAALLKFLAVLAQELGLELESIRSHSRIARFAWPRMMGMAIAREFFPDATFDSIGRVFAKDRGTVISALRSVQNRLDTEPQARQQFDALRARLRVKLNGSLSAPSLPSLPSVKFS